MLGKLTTLPVVALMLGFAPAYADPASSFRGQAYAQGMCASCHAISNDDSSSPNPAATPFRSIKSTYGSGSDLADWVNTKHPSIPNSLLKTDQADDILAYIVELKGAGAK